MIGYDNATLRALLDEQAALRRVAMLVASDPEPQEVFDCVCEEIATVLGIEGTNLTRFEDDGTQNVLAGWSVNGTPIFPVGPRVPLEGDAAVAKVSRSGQPERVDDYATVDGELAEMIRAAGIASSVAAPIWVAGRLWGAIVATTGQPNSFAEGTEQRLVSFTKLVANALANADAREQLSDSRLRIVEATDAERRRLERNLHDGAQQRLVSLALVLREAEANLDEDLDTTRQRLAEAREELALAIGELRELARGIHPAILTDRGLRVAVEALARRSPTPVRLLELPAWRLPPQLEAAAYYLVAEALTNVARHAGANEASVRVAVGANRITVEVSDDGVGGGELRSGSGLYGLRDRFEALGGSLEVESPPGDGMTVRGELPFDYAASE
jgi:signal transduction histidine kinase